MNPKSAAKLERRLIQEEAQLRERLLAALPTTASTGYDLFTNSHSAPAWLAHRFADNDDLLSAAEQCIGWRDALGLRVDGSVGQLYLAGCAESASTDPHRRGPRKLATWLHKALSQSAGT